MDSAGATEGNDVMIYLAGFIATVPLANWMIGNVGTFCIPDGPCMIPVGFGLNAPSGVLAIGAALVLRDLVQERYGKKVALIAIFAGAILSYLLSDPFIALASLIAYLLAETSDLLVYSKIRSKSLELAIFASGVVGSIIDSAVFLWIAFGSMQFIEGQIVGKIWMSLVAIAILKGIKHAKRT